MGLFSGLRELEGLIKIGFNKSARTLQSGIRAAYNTFFNYATLNVMPENPKKSFKHIGILPRAAPQFVTDHAEIAQW